MVSEGSRALARVSQHIGLIDKVFKCARGCVLDAEDGCFGV